jgi:hypothetical protein
MENLRFVKMEIIYYHNTEKDVPNIVGICEYIFKKYGVKIEINQSKPQNPYMMPYFKITKININKKECNGHLEKVLTDIREKIKLSKI